MAESSDKKKTKKLSKQDAKKTLPLLKKLNKLSQGFLQLLEKQVSSQREKVSTLSIMVSGMKIPEQNQTLNVKLIDINDTRGIKKGKGLFNQKMDWEDDLRHRNRGIVL
jgi:hypothetical protein